MPDYKNLQSLKLLYIYVDVQKYTAADIIIHIRRCTESKIANLKTMHNHTNKIYIV